MRYQGHRCQPVPLVSVACPGAVPERPLRVTLITSRARVVGGSLVDLVAAAAGAGVDRIQVREKDLDDRSLIELIGCIRRVVSPFRPRVLVNGRPDIALVCGADGVQLPEAGLPVAEVKQAFRALEVGASRHDLAGAVAAEAAGADFVVLGPVYPTQGEADRALGSDGLETVTARLGIPVDAVGGITPDNAGKAEAAGAAGVAAIGAFLVGDLESTIASLRGIR